MSVQIESRCEMQTVGGDVDEVYTTMTAEALFQLMCTLFPRIQEDERFVRKVTLVIQIEPSVES